MRTRIARKLLYAALAVVCLTPGLWAQKKAGQITRQIQPAQVQRSQAAAAAARPAGAGGIMPKITPVAATDKMPLYWTDTLITGSGGRMRAQLEDGSILSLGQDSKMVVTEHNSRTQQSTLQLEYGRVRAQVVKLSRPDSKFEIRTQTAICGVLGTDEYVEATSTFSTLVMNLSDPNSRSQVEVRNSNPRVTGTVVLNPGQATVVDQGKPPAGARQASSSEVGRAQQDTNSGDQPMATPILQVASGTVSPGETPTARIEAGAQLTLDGRLSMAGTSAISGFLWQIPKRNFQSNEPMLVVSTNDWAPGSYEGSLTVTTAQNKTASARFTIVIAASLAGRSAPDDAIQALARAYESLQVSQFLSYFDQQNYSGYASLEQTINQSFANIAENRVLVRKANGTVSGDTAVYQVEFEIRFLPKNSALPQSGVPGMSPSASAPPMLVPMRSGVRAAALASISGSTGAVATFVTLSGLTTPMKLFVNTGTGTAYSFKDLPVGRYVITPSRNGFTFNPASRTVDLTETGLTDVDFTATGLTQVVRETVTVQLQYIPNASWHIRNLSGPIGSAGLVGVPGVGNPDQGVDTSGSGSGNVAVADFKVTAAPQNLPPIARGGGGTPVTVTIEPLNGFKGTVNIAWTAGPGVSVAPPAQAVAITSGPVTQTFTVSAGASAALGDTGIQFIAESGAIKKQGTNTFTVYGLTLSQAGPAVSIFAGGSTAQLQIKVDTAPTITTPITVSASGPGITSSTATVNGNGTPTLTLTSSGPDTGATTVTVTASGAGIPSATLAVPVTRVAPFTLSGGGAVSFVAGEKGSVSFGVTLASGFPGPVVVTAPSIGALSFSPASVSLSSSGTATFSVTAAAEFTGSGTFTATAGSYSASGAASFDVKPALEFTVTGGSIAVMAGQSGTVSVNITQTKGAPVQFSASASGVTGGISVSGGGIVMGGGTVTFTVSVPKGTATGAASFTVQVTGGTITRTVTVAVSITAEPPVAFSLSGGSITLAAGASGPVSVSVSQTSGPTAAISVSVGSFDSSKISVSGGGTVNGSGSVTFQVTAASGLPDTSASFTVIASSGNVTQTATVGVSITSVADFTISGGSVSVLAGGPPVPVSVQASQTAGNPLPISVSASTITGPIAVSGGGSVTGSGSVTFNVTAPANAAAGPASFVVVGNLAGVTHSATVSVTIQAQPEFTIGGASITLLAGASGTVSIPVKQTSGAPVSISVTATGVDSTKLSVSGGGSVTGEGTVTFSVTALATAPAGSASFTVVASYGSITRSATVTVTIDRFTLAGPGSLSVPEGGDGTVTLTLTPASFTGKVSIATTASSGLTVSGPASVSAAGGTYTIAAGAGAPDGTVVFTATSESMTSSISVNVSVRDAVESASASGGSSFPTGTVAIEVAVGRGAGYNGPVVVDLGGTPSGISVFPSSVTVDAGKSTATFSAMIASGATTGGTVSFTAHIPGSSRQKSATASITVVPPFTLGGGGGLTVMPGDDASGTVNVGFASGFSGPVSVSASGGTGSITVSPSSLTSSGSASIRISVAASATPGTSTITVTASGAGITQTTTITLTINVAPPSAGSIQVVSGSGQSAPAGAALPSPLVVLVNSKTGSPFPGATVTFAVSPAGAATLSSTTATAGSDGKASVTLTMGSTPGSITVTATVTGVSGTATFSLTIVPGMTITIVSSNSQSGAVGQALASPLVVKVTDSSGNPAAGVAVSFQVTAGQASLMPTTANTGTSGQAETNVTLGTTAGTVTVTASASGAATPVTFNLTVLAGAPRTLTVVSGTPQSGTVGQALTNPLVAKVTDSYGNAVPSTTVGFQVTFGTATLSAASVSTGTNGQAQVTVTLGATAGAVTVTASIYDVATVTFNLTALASTPATLTVVSGTPQSGAVGQALANPLVVKVTDSSGNPVAGVVVSFQVTAGTAALSAASANTGTNGQAQVTVTVGTTAGAVTVTASTSGVATPVTFNLSAVAGGPAAITMVSGSPQSGTVGAPLTPPLVVKVTDSSGNPVSNVTVTFSAPTELTLSATSATTGTNGQAQVNVTGLPSLAGTYTVTASVSGVTPPATFSLTALGGAPATLTIVSGTPQSGTVGTALASPLVVKVADAYGNLLSGVAVSFQVTAGGGTLGATSVTTAANGQAQTTWTPGTAGMNTVAASVPSAPSIPAVTFTATAVLPPGVVSIGSGQAAPGVYASVPVNINFTYLTADGVSFSVMVSPVGGAPALTGTGNFSFTPGGGIPNPTLTDTGARPDTISLSFLNVSPALTGVMVLGQLRIKVPPTATAGQTYTIHVTGGSANLGGSTSIPVQSGADGTLTVNPSAPPTGGGMVSATSVSGAPGTTVPVPITVLFSGAAADTLSFSFTIVAGGSGLPMTTTLSFVATGAPPPGTINASTPSLISVAWLTPLISPPLSGSVTLGNVLLPIPSTGVAANETYTLRITGSSATSSGASLSMTPGPDATLTITAPVGDLQPMSRSARAELDIPADELTYTPSFPREGDTVKFRVRVRNRGRGDARDAELALLARDRVIASERLNISAGRSATVELAWKAEAAAAGDLRFALRTAGQPDSGQPEDKPPAVTLRLRNFAVERRGGLASLRRERFTVDVRNEGCSGLRLLTGSQTSCGGSADIEFSAFINENGRIVLQAFANDGGLIDLGVQPLASVAAAPGAGYLPQGMLESGRTYAVKARNRYALVRIARVASSVNPRLVADERKRNDSRRTNGRVTDEDPFQGIRDARTLDRVLDSARISIQIEYLVQEDGSVNFQ
jgi:hypothetical protein